MRLIDATSLMIHFNDWALAASPTGHETARESTMKVKEYDTIQTAMEGIANAPTIDAIPVEWLVNEMNMADDRGDMEMTDAISWLIQEWQKEQEAR